MTEVELEILRNRTESIMDAVGALVDEQIITHCDEDTSCFHDNDVADSDGYTLTMDYTVNGEDTVVIELIVRQNEEGYKECFMFTWDYDQNEKNRVLPGLKEYLLAHPSLQYPDFDEDTDFNYYLNKKVEYKQAKTAFVSLALAVDEYITEKEKED